MSRAGFETAIPATKRPQTYALEREASEVCIRINTNMKFHIIYFNRDPSKMDGTFSWHDTQGW
jgi:hypothetical protein